MNVPLGTPEKKGEKLQSRNVITDLQSFARKGGAGYLCITTKTEAGVEEGLLVMESGSAIAANYEYLKYGQTFSGKPALDRVMNACLAGEGIYDIYTLAPQQIELVKIFNEDLLLQEPIAFGSVQIHGSFSKEFTAGIVKMGVEAMEEKREEVLKRYGISEVDIDATEASKEDLLDKYGVSKVDDPLSKSLDTYLKQPRVDMTRPVTPGPRKPEVPGSPPAPTPREVTPAPPGGGATRPALKGAAPPAKKPAAPAQAPPPTPSTLTAPPTPSTLTAPPTPAQPPASAGKPPSEEDIEAQVAKLRKLIFEEESSTK
jgi:hypothetical protein